MPSLYPIGGAETFVLSLSKYFSSQKNKVVIISLYNTSSEYIDSFLRLNNIGIIFLDKKKGIDFKCAKKLRKIIKEKKPDICHLHLDTYITFFLSHSYKMQPTFYTLHTSVTKEIFGSILKPRNYLLKKLFKKKSLCPISISNIISNQVCTYFGLQKCETIFNGVDTAFFKYQPHTNNRFTFISIGRMIDIKNNLFMIKCFEVFQKKYPEATYLVIGDGNKRKECIDYCETNKLKNVIFIKETNDVASFLNQSSCLLLASKFEGNPMVVNEAIACGVWVIANPVGGIPDIIDNNCGYLSTLGSDDSFIKLMESFYINQKTIVDKTIPNSIVQNRLKVSIIRTGNEYLDLFQKNLRKYGK